MLYKYLISIILSLFLTQALSASPGPDPENLALASVSAMVARVDEPAALYQKRADWVVPIASITKVMTAMVVLDSGADLDQRLTVEDRHFPAAANAYSRIRPESEARRRDLLHIALMSSENYAAYLLARHHPEGYDGFIQAMNDKAVQLGMVNTHFVDSSGLSTENVSTAADLMKMLKAAYGYPFIREATSSAKLDVWFTSPGYSLYYANTNPLVRSSRWDVSLSKTGYLTDAGRCLVMVTEIEGKPTAMVFLDSFGRRTPLGDAGRVKRWLTTGQGGSVAGAARRYEQEKSQTLASAHEQDDA